MDTRYLVKNDIDCLVADLPGNVGIRVIDPLPVNSVELFKERKIVKDGLTCDRTLERHPKILEDPNEVDYPSEEDSDDDVEFDLKIPDLNDLINEFEKEDEVLHEIASKKDERARDAHAGCLKREPREDIIDFKSDKLALLNKNISVTRKDWEAKMPGRIQDLNEKIK